MMNNVAKSFDILATILIILIIVLIISTIQQNYCQICI